MTFQTEAQIADAVRTSQDTLSIIGGGTRSVRDAQGPTLSLAGYSGIDLYEPEALTLIAKAGTPMEEIEATLDAQGQMLAFEPMDHRTILGTTGTPTLGGAVGGNISGPRRISAGAARDFILGARFVTGSGDIVKNGGRVMKNVTGYDLSRLLAGSWGHLAVMTQIALKTLPKPEATQTLSFSGLDATAARDVMSRAMGLPYDVSGATSTYLNGKMSTYLRLEGLAPSVARRSAALAQALSEFGPAEVMDQEASLPLWGRLRDVTDLAAFEGDIWVIHTRPTDAPAVIAQLSGDYIMDWAGGRIWATAPKGGDLRARVDAMGGHIRPVRSDHPVFAPQSGAMAQLSQALKAQLDPTSKFAALEV